MHLFFFVFVGFESIQVDWFALRVTSKLARRHRSVLCRCAVAPAMNGIRIRFFLRRRFGMQRRALSFVCFFFCNVIVERST